jgi:hypothetical protein
MTLNEKLYKKTGIYIMADNVEKIADDFAIGFAEWIFTNGRETIRKANEDGLKSTKELLEIYKKEKLL